MKAKVQVINERTESFTGKRGKVEQTILACLDLDSTHAFINTFDYVLEEAEKTAHAGKIVGKIIELAIRNMAPAFGGRLRASGSILSVSQ